MNDFEQKKDFVLNLYPGKKWRARVRNKMSDAQIIAIYLREHDKPKKKDEPAKESGQDEIPF
jgi:hypothetical protein